VTTQLR